MELRGCNRQQSAANRGTKQTARTNQIPLPPGLRFESGRGLCKNAARRRFLVQVDLLNVERATGMEPFLELPRVDEGHGRAGPMPSEPPPQRRW